MINPNSHLVIVPIFNTTIFTFSIVELQMCIQAFCGVMQFVQDEFQKSTNIQHLFEI